MDIIDEILKTLIHRGKALECNTAGFKYGLGHPHPQEEILLRYRELGGAPDCGLRRPYSWTGGRLLSPDR